MTSSSPVRWIDTPTACKALGSLGLSISPRYLRQLLDEGVVPSGVVRRLPVRGSFLRWNREALLAWAVAAAAEDL